MKRIFFIVALATVISLPSFAGGDEPKKPVIINPVGSDANNYHSLNPGSTYKDRNYNFSKLLQYIELYPSDN